MRALYVTEGSHLCLTARGRYLALLRCFILNTVCIISLMPW
uniref:Uncharacterized protein n=1 Tax=Rhizophora mucronata TaxID=61149 RepID=A0A2P2Q022_RHIMU